jgi:hypothetical protein
MQVLSIRVFTAKVALGLALVGGIYALGGAVAADQAEAIRYDRTCGYLPGDGAYSFVRAKNTTCKRAWKTTRKAYRKFCEANNDCRLDPFGDITYVYRGTVRRNGWRCKVASGWEYVRVKCRKGDRVVIWKTAA